MVAVDTAVEFLKDTDRLAKPETAERPEQMVCIRCAGQVIRAFQVQI